MARYFSRPHRVKSSGWIDDDWERLGFEEEEPFRPSLDVPDHEATDTGLVDHRGDPIMRGPNPMGFVWRD